MCKTCGYILPRKSADMAAEIPCPTTTNDSPELLEMEAEQPCVTLKRTECGSVNSADDSTELADGLETVSEFNDESVVTDRVDNAGQGPNAVLDQCNNASMETPKAVDEIRISRGYNDIEVKGAVVETSADTQIGCRMYEDGGLSSASDCEKLHTKVPDIEPPLSSNYVDGSVANIRTSDVRDNVVTSPQDSGEHNAGGGQWDNDDANTVSMETTDERLPTPGLWSDDVTGTRLAAANLKHCDADESDDVIAPCLSECAVSVAESPNTAAKDSSQHGCSDKDSETKDVRSNVVTSPLMYSDADSVPVAEQCSDLSEGNLNGITDGTGALPRTGKPADFSGENRYGETIAGHFPVSQGDTDHADDNVKSPDLSRNNDAADVVSMETGHHIPAPEHSDDATNDVIGSCPINDDNCLDRSRDANKDCFLTAVGLVPKTMEFEDGIRSRNMAEELRLMENSSSLHLSSLAGCERSFSNIAVNKCRSIWTAEHHGGNTTVLNLSVGAEEFQPISCTSNSSDDLILSQRPHSEPETCQLLSSESSENPLLNTFALTSDVDPESYASTQGDHSANVVTNPPSAKCVSILCDETPCLEGPGGLSDINQVPGGFPDSSMLVLEHHDVQPASETGKDVELPTGIDVLASVCESLINVSGKDQLEKSFEMVKDNSDHRCCAAADASSARKSPETGDVMLRECDVIGKDGKCQVDNGVGSAVVHTVSAGCDVDDVSSVSDAEDLDQTDPDSDEDDEYDKEKSSSVLPNSAEPASPTDDDSSEYETSFESSRTCYSTTDNESVNSSDYESEELNDEDTTEDSEDSEFEVAGPSVGVLGFDDNRNFDRVTSRASDQPTDDAETGQGYCVVYEDISDDSNNSHPVNSPLNDETVPHFEQPAQEICFAALPSNDYIHGECSKLSEDGPATAESLPQTVCAFGRQLIKLEISEDCSSEFWWRSGADVPGDGDNYELCVPHEEKVADFEVKETDCDNFVEPVPYRIVDIKIVGVDSDVAKNTVFSKDDNLVPEMDRPCSFPYRSEMDQATTSFHSQEDLVVFKHGSERLGVEDGASRTSEDEIFYTDCEDQGLESKQVVPETAASVDKAFNILVPVTDYNSGTPNNHTDAAALPVYRIENTEEGVQADNRSDGVVKPRNTETLTIHGTFLVRELEIPVFSPISTTSDSDARNELSAKDSQAAEQVGISAAVTGGLPDRGNMRVGSPGSRDQQVLDDVTSRSEGNLASAQPGRLGDEPAVVEATATVARSNGDESVVANSNANLKNKSVSDDDVTLMTSPRNDDQMVEERVENVASEELLYAGDHSPPTKRRRYQDAELLLDDDKRSRDQTSDPAVPHSTTVYRWCFVPSTTHYQGGQDDRVVPEIIRPLQTCSRPPRLGLSRRHKFPALHPYYTGRP